MRCCIKDMMAHACSTRNYSPCYAQRYDPPGGGVHFSTLPATAGTVVR